MVGERAAVFYAMPRTNTAEIGHPPEFSAFLTYKELCLSETCYIFCVEKSGGKSVEKNPLLLFRRGGTHAKKYSLT